MKKINIEQKILFYLTSKNFYILNLITIQSKFIIELNFSFNIKARLQ